MNRFLIYFTILIAAASMLCTSCIEDGIDKSPSSQPVFSTDTLNMGLVYTNELTKTHRISVHNPHNKGLMLDRVAVGGEHAGLFRINVDGQSGDTFSNIEIRANDSIYVFVDATLPENGADAPAEINATLDFTCNGLTSSVLVTALGQDVDRLHGAVYNQSMRFTAGKPIIVYDSLVVMPGATLYIEAGAVVKLHDKAFIDVLGTIRCQGTPEAPVRITGDRPGEVLPGVSFDIMSRQWDCINIYPTSKGNYMAYTEIANSSYGLAVYGDGSDLDTPKLTLENCRLHNSGECVLLAFDASVEAYGCEFAEAGHSLVYLVGGKHRFDQCTASNHYLFTAVQGAAFNFINPADTEQYANSEPTEALITNSIIWGIGPECTPADLAGRGIYFKRCLFKSEGENDDNFVDCIWDADPLFYTVREDYLFDYRLKPESPAIGAALSDLSEHPLDTDFYGQPRTQDLGAYVYVAPEPEDEGKE